MKQIAVIGGGFAGLSTAYYLLISGASVSIFEKNKVGGGASGTCSGLLHPYPGLAARRSTKALEAMTETKRLIRFAETHTPRLVALQNGILRKSMSGDQKERLLNHRQKWGDIEWIKEELFLIHSGITVHSENYLEGLKNGILSLGGKLYIQTIETLNELQEFDAIVIAAGYGISQFPECQTLDVKFLKGQALILQGQAPMERSFISKGYIAYLGNQQTFEIGSTYEREFFDEMPDLKKAKTLLQEKLLLCQESKILECKAGIRVASKKNYLPIIEKLSERIFVFTGLGSRGLLYHALYGKKLVEALLFKNTIFS